MEEWVEIPETDYSVSSEGRVASWKYGKLKILKTPTNSAGYPVFRIHKDGERKQYTVHRWVAILFLGLPPTSKHEVNHTNGVKADNRDANLEWVTPSENQHHRYDVLGKRARAKLSEAQVREIRARCASGETQSKVAADYGVHQTSVCAIVKRGGWAWVK